MGSLLLIEIGLRVLDHTSVRFHLFLENIGGRVSAYAYCWPLGTRPIPEYADHDRRGYRNAWALDHATVVALGDSQTYGMGVVSGQAWPQQLSARIGEPVYNMGWGSWGPMQSFYLWPQIDSLHPTAVVVAVYTGNDLFDCYRMHYHYMAYPEFGELELDPLADLVATGALDALPQRVQAVYDHDPVARERQGLLELAKEIWPAHLDDPEQPEVRTLIPPDVRAPPSSPLPRSPFRLVDIGNGLRARFRGVSDPANLRSESATVSPTILTVARRLAGVDLRDPTVVEGLRLCLLSCQALGKCARDDGIRLFVLLIPTKELVYAPYVQGDSENYQILVQYEERCREIIKKCLISQGIPVVDSLPDLQSCLEGGGSPYPPSEDGHPTAEGHGVLAAAVAEAM